MVCYSQNDRQADGSHMAVLSIQRQFWDAIERRDVGRVRDLIAAGANVNARGKDPDGETPLMLAVVNGDPSVVEVLVHAGANVNSAGILSGWTPLMLAREYPGIMQQLIAAGADVNARVLTRDLISPISGNIIRRGGETALHLAAAANNAEAVKILIQAGADIEARAENGLAPLDYALKLGSPTEACVALVEAGAKLTPEREEFMVSAAHNPESDIWEFPWSMESYSPPGSAHPKAPPPIPSGEAHCPKCGALLYTRRSRKCGQCNAIIPAELVVTDQRVQAERKERRWAHDIADEFDSQAGRNLRSAPPETTPRSYSPAELARRINADYESRDWWRVPLIFYLLPAGILFLVLLRVQGLPQGVAFLILLTCLFAGYMAWRRAK